MLKHNKKRNTLVLYEQLVSLVAKLTLMKKNEEATHVVSFIKEHFNPKTEIGKEYRVLQSIMDCRNKSRDDAEKILEEALKESRDISVDKIEKEKSRLISEINKKITKKLYNVPLKNYKIMASTQILFNESRMNKYTTAEERVKIKKTLTENMQRPVDEKYKIDNFTFKVLINKFNKRYFKLMNESQKEVLSAWAFYVVNENSEEMTSFLNERVGLLKEELRPHSGKNQELGKVYKKLCSYTPQANEEDVYTVMRYYDLLETLNQEFEKDDKKD